MTTMMELRGGAVPELTLGWRLQMALGYAGMSVHEMADELGLHRKSLSRWLNGHGPEPRVVYLKQWALRTGVDYTWLKTGVPSSNAGPDPVGGGWAPRGSNPQPTDYKSSVHCLRTVVPMRRRAA